MYTWGHTQAYLGCNPLLQIELEKFGRKYTFSNLFDNFCINLSGIVCVFYSPTVMKKKDSFFSVQLAIAYKVFCCCFSLFPLRKDFPNSNSGGP